MQCYTHEEWDSDTGMVIDKGAKHQRKTTVSIPYDDEKLTA